MHKSNSPTAAGCLAPTPKAPDLQEIIDDLLCELQQLDHGLGLICGALNRLGAPEVQRGPELGKAQEEPGDAIARLRAMVRYLRAQRIEAHMLANRLSQTI